MLIGVCVGGVSLLLSGCGGGGGSEPAPEPTPAPTPAAPTPAPTLAPGCSAVADETPPWTPRIPAGICPGPSDDVACPGNGCCPGITATGGRTFPCPTAEPSAYSNCEGGLDDLVSALLEHLNKQEKYRFLRGHGWNGTWNPLPGYYVGNAAMGLPYGIPSQNMQDNGNGIRNDYLTKVSESMAYNGECFPRDKEQVTSFPVSLAIASSWGEDEMSRFGEALGREMRAKGVNVLLGPAVNVHRVPRNGRNAEYMSGESGYFGARLIKRYIRAVQNQGVLCSVKHFINNNQEGCRRTSNSIVDDRTRWEVYYPPFEAAVQADVATQMCGYNYVNSVPNCASKQILLEDLKGKLNFTGWVQSDWWAVYSFDVVEAGIDQEMPGTPAPDPAYPALFNDANLDTLSDEKVNSMVRPQLYYMAKYGLMVPSEDTCQPGGGCGDKYYNTQVWTDQSLALSRELATKAVTLLKNGDLSGGGKSLPLPQNVGKILLLGKACDHPADVDFQTEDWTRSNYYHIGGSGKVITKKPISILAAFTSVCGNTDGYTGYTCEVKHVNEDNAAQALAEAAEFQPTTAILCGGVTSSENADRPNLKINEDSFVAETAVALAGNINTIVLTMTAGTIVMPWIDNVDAMLNVFLPGKFAGPAFADTLFGVSNPSAKTPIAYPKDEADTIVPCACDDLDVVEVGGVAFNVSNCEYTEGLMISWYGRDPSKFLFPFGFGLSYTTFAYANVMQYNAPADVTTHCPDQDADLGAAVICVTVEVENSGSVAGVEVPQLYLGFPAGAEEPPKVLRGFQRLAELAPGAKATAAFPLYVRDLQIYDTGADGWTRPAGEFKIFVGRNSDDPQQTEQVLTLPAGSGTATGVRAFV